MGTLRSLFEEQSILSDHSPYLKSSPYFKSDHSSIFLDNQLCKQGEIFLENCCPNSFKFGNWCLFTLYKDNNSGLKKWKISYFWQKMSIFRSLLCNQGKHFVPIALRAICMKKNSHFSIKTDPDPWVVSKFHNFTIFYTILVSNTAIKQLKKETFKNRAKIAIFGHFLMFFQVISILIALS